jgi:YidC/Oxa1 family membrane protein insertase
MMDMLYYIIIYPVELLIESAFSFTIVVLRHNYGLAIIGISFLVSLLCLPLYAKAEILQSKEREIQKSMAKRIVSIKRNFSGDEKYLILSMYYRENHYHPIMALRSAISLLIQIPFFIAAYSFLSHFELLKGVPFLIIHDLSSPDRLFSLGNFTINLLPVFMTLINIAASFIYSKGFLPRERAQLFIMAFVFLILLYNSPAALVIYWTCNNIFSLLKNIVYKLKIKRPIIIVYSVIMIGLTVVLCYVLFFRPHSQVRSKKAALVIYLLMATIPIFVKLINWIGKRYFSGLAKNIKQIQSCFILLCFALFLLCGIVIPFNLVASDPAAFSFLDDKPSPFNILRLPVFISFGLFVFWPVYIFLLSSKKIKILVFFLTSCILTSGIIDAFIFHGNYGVVSQTLTYPIGADFIGDKLFWLLNIGIILLASSMLLLLCFLGKIKILSVTTAILLLGWFSIGIWKSIDIQTQYNQFKDVGEGDKIENFANDLTPIVNLSREGKNVVIVMLDRAVGSYVPLIFDDLPYLKKDFSGFIYFPNTVSFYDNTILGAPPIFGGYEYTPEKLHERKNELMFEKHNEALLVLPFLFMENGYSVAAFDLPYVNYQEIADPSFFHERGIASSLLNAAYTQRFLKELGEDAPLTIDVKNTLKRNFVMFSLFSIFPPVLRGAIYRNGSYWSAKETDLYDIIETIDAYAPLYYLPDLTNFKENGDNLVIISSILTHKASFLQYPEYSVKKDVTDLGKDFFNGDEFSLQNYHVNAASYILLAKWFECMKNEGVYDNTRIIIVADHDTICVKPLFSKELNSINTGYNPTFMVKDFDATGEIQTDTAFMTNADVPHLASQNLIPDPRNPFTHKELLLDKANGVNILVSKFKNPRTKQSYRALELVSRFYHVCDDIFNINNWTPFTKKYPD